MAKYRKIDPRIWNDAKFMSLSDDGKLLFLFLLTHPHMTALGAMRASALTLAEDLDWLPERVTESLSEGLSKGMIKHDRKARFLSLPNWFKYNKPENPNVLKAWVTAVDQIPECQLKLELYHNLKAFVEGLTEGFMKAFTEAFPKPFATPLPNQEQEQEQELEQEQEQDKNNTSCRNSGETGSTADVVDLPRCPVQKIVDLYHEKLPELPKVQKLTKTRAGYIHQRWREDLPDLTHWENFFEHVRQSDFLMGRTPGRNGQPPFRADLEWITKPANFVKIAEEKYHASVR